MSKQSHVEWSEAQQDLQLQKKRDQEWAEERAENLKQAKAEVNELMLSGEFGYEDIADIMMNWGFEMDGIEEWIGFE